MWLSDAADLALDVAPWRLSFDQTLRQYRVEIAHFVFERANQVIVPASGYDARVFDARTLMRRDVVSQAKFSEPRR
jgi:hypothetical protein